MISWKFVPVVKRSGTGITNWAIVLLWVLSKFDTKYNRSEHSIVIDEPIRYTNDFVQ